MLYEQGDVLIPNQDFRMETGERSFTEGVGYSVDKVSPDGYILIDDQGDKHFMSERDVEGWLWVIQQPQV